MEEAAQDGDFCKDKVHSDKIHPRGVQRTTGDDPGGCSVRLPYVFVSAQCHMYWSSIRGGTKGIMCFFRTPKPLLLCCYHRRITEIRLYSTRCMAGLAGLLLRQEGKGRASPTFAPPLPLQQQFPGLIAFPGIALLVAALGPSPNISTSDFSSVGCTAVGCTADRQGKIQVPYMQPGVDR